MRTPSDVLCKRLDELSKAVTQGRETVGREFTMRVPAEPDRDADLVLSSAAERIRELEASNADLYQALKESLHFMETANVGPPRYVVTLCRAALAKARGEEPPR